MEYLNKRLSRHFARGWLLDNALAGLIGVAIICTLLFFTLNTDLSSTVEVATVSFSVTAPDKYSSADAYVIARLSDGKTIQLYLPPGWIPPSAGNQIRVKRITRLFFGERFVLLQQP
jgi:hypothetical protein